MQKHIVLGEFSVGTVDDQELPEKGSFSHRSNGEAQDFFVSMTARPCETVP